MPCRLPGHVGSRTTSLEERTHEPTIKVSLISLQLRDHFLKGFRD